MLKHLSHDEKKRMQTLDELQKTDTSQDDILHKLTNMACQLLETPTALVTLTGSKSLHVKAKTHFPLDDMDKIGSFDHFTVQTGQSFICPDATQDDRFKDSPYVTGEPFIRFYAGVPLKTKGGYSIGTFSVIDCIPRTFSKIQLRLLHDLATIAMVLMEYRNAIGLIDAVTLLPNRQRLIDDISHITDIHEPYLLILIDTIDISYAYEMGCALGMPTVEGLLKDIGVFLRLSLNSSDNLYSAAVGRFALLVKADRKEQVLAELDACAERIHESITSHIPLKLEFFVGYTEFQIPAKEPQQILRESMSALHTAITKNIRQFAYDPEADKAQQIAFTLLNELADVLQNKKQGLYLVYQPKLNIKTNTVIGAEALIRWRHPELGEIYPDQFIPLAEGTTLMRPLTDWVTREAACQVKQWRQEGLTFPVSINVSAKNFSENDFIPRLITILENHGLTPQDIDIECVETQKIIESTETLATIQTLQQLGFTIALDDFGTGYSNLSYLRNIPSTVIKLDKSLIKDIKTDRKSRVIVQSVISMLHKLNYIVLAEGVENKETLEYLAHFGCDEVQGYYFSRPIPPDAFTTWLTTRSSQTSA
ncbi:EAL domain-containing protein [Pectobacterium parvum]|uniref:EAL domain-containing protein n=1 Tax=Pectobacterium parvum TaxID=2778550 RepID=A0AAP9IKZ0_9GAMM|nr:MULTISPECIES: EAL domain-containing protein [Pectobacterium]GKW43767.1 sensor domain-containing phosphodiesterase [Pectobacterium carotovorum subsp. carotovorum]KFX18844.1 diguanylate phosphodiesterase [Pectobacterium parvum]KHS94852.1 diguanylate phosphodiesterase [Pectobacterium parvum]MCU1802191.1 sensor domain-containing phosphodiesterase [Pectobacterium parvum]QHQ25706.1 EAL domain-containing protein [Pectobacterium parvum]